MQFLNLYNQSPFKSKVIWREVSDKNAQEALEAAQNQTGHNESKDYKKVMESNAADSVKSMRTRTASFEQRLKNMHLTRKGAVDELVDKETALRLSAKTGALAEQKEGALKALNAQYEGKIKQKLGMSLTKYNALTEKVNVCNDLVRNLEDQIKQAEQLKDLYAAARAYNKKGTGIGPARFPLKGKIVDAVNYSENQKMLAIVQKIREEARAKKEAYDQKIQEKFQEEYKLEDTLKQMLCLYNPKLVGEIDDLINNNALGDGKELADVIKDLRDNHGLSPEEAKNLRAIASALRSKKARTARAFNVVGKEATTIEKFESIIREMSHLNKGQKFTIKMKDGSEIECTATGIETHNGKKILLADRKRTGGIKKIAFNLTDKTYTEEIVKKTYTTRKLEEGIKLTIIK